MMNQAEVLCFFYLLKPVAGSTLLSLGFPDSPYHSFESTLIGAFFIFKLHVIVYREVRIGISSANEQPTTLTMMVHKSDEKTTVWMLKKKPWENSREKKNSSAFCPFEDVGLAQHRQAMRGALFFPLLQDSFNYRFPGDQRMSNEW